MFEVGEMTAVPGAAGARAEELFQQHRRQIFRQTDQLFARLMLFQWVACIVLALVVSPQTWDGAASRVHIHVWSALLIGGAISLFPVWMTRVWPGAAVTRHVIAVAQMLMSALLIALTGGRIETHFHVFGSLVILSFYRDWKVLVPATVVVALDHFLRGIYLPYSVYGVLAASPLRSVEHAGWVVFENVFLVISCLRSIKEMRFIANRTAALEASDQRSRQLFDDAPIGMAVVALDTEKFKQVNGSFADMIGYSEEELMARTPLELTHPEDLAETRRSVEAILNGTDRCAVEKRYLRKNGDVLWASRTACVIRDKDGQARDFLVMVEDITERKRAEEAVRETQRALHDAKMEADRANQAKSEFLSRMSHELRTPLNAILGFGQLLERQNPTVQQRARVEHIMSAGRHLLNLINEVLDISRIEAGHLQLSVEPVAVAQVLEEALDLMRPLAADRAMELIVDKELENDLHLLADRQRLKQVLLNLLTNAVKYTAVGGQVRVSVERTHSNITRLVVSDTGAGIPTEKLARLFTPFDRLDVEQSGVEGTGLGLALCQRLMQAMGGNIGVESVVGKGSAFWIELPAVDSPLSALPKRRNAAKDDAVAAGGGKILYIEDNLSNLTLVEQMLAEQPHIELLTAMQGGLGLDLARKHLPDLILLDLHLPDLRGHEVLARLRQDAVTRAIPVVVISADATARQIQRLMTAGAQNYLTKPLDVREFYRVIDETMRSPDRQPEAAVA
ncbi:MAG TPA: ATP-binding protein [Chthoniobacterales bacterium]|nr:ATP-binding protein [Chthoniobacterales bacterium]